MEKAVDFTQEAMERQLGNSAEEQPLVLQLGGGVASELSQASARAFAWCGELSEISELPFIAPDP